MAQGLQERWVIREADNAVCRKVARECGIHEGVARALVGRGFTSCEEVNGFLNPSLDDLYDPSAFVGMEDAVQRVQNAIASGNPICIYGDYDVDGLCSTAQIVCFFKELGIEVFPFIPKRHEDGYGLQLGRLEKLAGKGFRLFISVDCGTNNKEEARFLKEKGCELVVLDHHQVHSLPEDAIVVNPHRQDDLAFKDFASSGIVYYFLKALSSYFGKQTTSKKTEDFLDLAAIGTIGDVMPLVGQNRILAKFGLPLLREPKRVGIRALKEVAQIKNGVSSWAVSFALAPRLNATGRLGDANVSLDLLLSTDLEEARLLAQKLDQENRDRQILQNDVRDQAVCIVDLEALSHKALVLCGEGWHEGVLGIVASKMVEMFHRPCIVLTRKDDALVGSGRSIACFDLGKAIDSLRGLLLRGGGHRLAAGLTLKDKDFPEFRKRFFEIADRDIADDALVPELQIDAVIELRDLNEKLFQDCMRLEPFGVGNKEPVFMARDVGIRDLRIVGKNEDHLALRLKQGRDERKAVFFRFEERVPRSFFDGCGNVDVAFAVSMDDYTGDACARIVSIRKGNSA
jgi:single-stranded-DNA-specific exonuclease